MKLIQLTTTLQNIKSILCVCLCLLLTSVVYSQLPPMNVNNNTASGDNQHLACKDFDPIPDNFSVVFNITNNYVADLAIIDFDASDIFFEDLSSNSVVNMTFTSDGLTYNGYPRWDQGNTQTVTVFFSNRVRSTRSDRTFTLGATILNQNMTDRNYRIYSGSGCFRDPVILQAEGPKGSNLKGSRENAIQLEMKPEKSSIKATLISDFMPRMTLEVEDIDPVSIYVLGITNVGYYKQILKDTYLQSGLNELELPELPIGLYQIIIKQGQTVEYIKYAHTFE